MELNKIHNVDCLEFMRSMSDQSVDLVLTDPPYGVTQNKNDVVVDLSDLFRIAKGVVMTTQQPYTTDVIQKHRKEFKYDLVWNKVLTTGFLNANHRPLRSHEHILVFGKVVYNPQKTVGKKNHSKGAGGNSRRRNYGKHKSVDNADALGRMKHPKSIVEFTKPHPAKALHPTQKPVELMEYLIKTYSNEGDTIFDPFLGSGTTAVAAKQLGRNYIGCEIFKKYYDIAAARLVEETQT